ncbi:hypothetical protein HAX54_027535, partial [Datura stramonium]|nr:hypothetical protein [Datura stramonium]
TQPSPFSSLLCPPSPLSSLLCLVVAVAVASQFSPLSRRCLSVLSSVSPSPSLSPISSLLCLASSELCLADLHLLSILYSVSPTRRRPLSSLQWRVSTARLLEANNTNCIFVSID